MPFARDTDHWLLRFSPREWMNASMAELSRAEEAYRRHDARGGLAGCRRAAGMAINALMIVRPGEAFGRTYVDHIRGLERDASAPAAVARACRLLLDTEPPGGPLVILRAKNAPVVEAARDVMAHAYAMVLKSDPESVSA